MHFHEKEPTVEAPLIVDELPEGLSEALIAANGKLLLNEPMKHGRRVIFIKNVHMDHGIFRESPASIAAFYAHQKHAAAFLRSLAALNTPHYFQFEALTPAMCENPEPLRRDTEFAKNLWPLVDQYPPHELLGKLAHGFNDWRVHRSMHEQSIAPASVWGDMLFNSNTIHKVLPGHRPDFRLFKEIFLEKIKALAPVSASFTDADLENLMREYLQERNNSGLLRHKFVREIAEVVPEGGVLVTTYGGDHFRLGETDIMTMHQGLETDFSDGFDRTLIEPFGGRELIHCASPQNISLEILLQNYKAVFAQLRARLGLR